MAKRKRATHPQTLSVGETARRLDVSPDTVRNYCERGLLQFIRVRGNHRRVLLASIESFEAERRAPANELTVQVTSPANQSQTIDEDFEIYYLGNDQYPNDFEAGYICNLSFFVCSITQDVRLSSILTYVGIQFGGGNFRLVRLRDFEVVSERLVSLPGPTKEAVLVMREISTDR